MRNLIGLVAAAAMSSGVIAQTYSSSNVTVGFQPDGIAKGDFDKDGDLDFVVAIAGLGGRGVFMANNGLGAFATTNLTIPGGQTHNSVAAGDVDGDGDLDAVFGSKTSGRFSVQLNNPTGTFVAGVTVNTNPNLPERLELADVTGDGNVDVVFVDRINRRIRIFVGNGAGGFTAGSVTLVGQLPTDVICGDLDGDGDIDLVTANAGQSSVSVLLGSGTGTFVRTDFAVSLQTHAVGLGDFNGDGFLDVVAASQFNNNFSLILGTGTGSFGTPSTTSAGGTGPADVELSDYDDDGNLDVAVSFLNSSNLSIVRGNGNGTFQAPLSIAGGGSMKLRMDAGDQNVDGRQDFALANNSLSTATLQLNTVGVPSSTTIFGSGTAGCFGRLGINANVAPRVNTPNFRVITTNAPALHTGALFFTVTADVPGTLFLGARWHIDLNNSPQSVALVSDQEGHASYGVPIPNDPGFIGLSLTYQSAWIEPVAERCSLPSGGIITSLGMTVTVRP